MTTNKKTLSIQDIDLKTLKERAFNYRWAEVPDGHIPLTAADSDFPPAKEIREDLIAYIEKGYFCYTPKTGLSSVKTAVAKALKERKNENVKEEFVLPIDSAARGMSITAKAVLEPGSEMLVFDPVDYLFAASAKSAGAEVVYYPCMIKDGKLDLSKLEEYISPRTKLIGFCNPHNPLGMCYTKEQLKELLDLANQYDLWILNDEVWSDIVYPDASFHSLLEFDDSLIQKVITVYGFSKSFAIAGLRAGVILTQSQEAYDMILETSEVLTTAGGVSSLTQVAMITCMTKCWYWVDAFIETMRINRDLAVSRIREMGLSVHTPEATFVLFIDIRKTGLSSEDFVKKVQDEGQVVLVPGSKSFFGPGAQGYVRLCFATFEPMLNVALERMERVVKTMLKK
ncbi:MAG: pyridoxal phosphate-dependent aminotransferase [Erysipelotrichaceae bacterium]|jgi:aspartate/methionine/tyrosine aminotransferase|nr:pyridoxal phosphate-dependent aminotransferase [Erysipelotrichaceae bacterium]